jgi:hypothetical protein
MMTKNVEKVWFYYYSDLFLEYILFSVTYLVSCLFLDILRIGMEVMIFSKSECELM